MVVAEAVINTEIVYLWKMDGRGVIAVGVIEPLDGVRLLAAYH